MNISMGINGRLGWIGYLKYATDLQRTRGLGGVVTATEKQCMSFILLHTRTLLLQFLRQYDRKDAYVFLNRSLVISYSK
jgi:hypothetical protein